MRYWSKQDWFGEALLRVDKADSDELKGTFTRIAKRAALELEDRLENGDEVIIDGVIHKKKLGGKELAIVMGVSTDKRKQMMEQPNHIPTQSSEQKLITLMENFMKFARAKEIKGEYSNETLPEDRRNPEEPL